ncbi:MAG: MOSC domain-containing protein, partial [Sulfurovum sp. 24-42-9]
MQPTVQPVGTVTNLFVSREGSSSRVVMSSISLDEKGILEDKYYDKNIHRSVLITSQESYLLTNDHNILLPRGA